MRANCAIILFVLAIDCLSFSNVFAQTPAAFTGIGDFPEGEYSSWADDISADGSIVVGTGTRALPPGNEGYGFEAFVWTPAGGMQGLGSSLGERGTASSVISGDGTVVGGFIFDSYPDRSVFMWNQSQGMLRVTGCSCEEFDSPDGLSYDGEVLVGRMQFSDGYRAYRWTQQSGAVDLGVLAPRGESAATDVSDDGSIVVGYTQTNRFHKAFIWDESLGMRILGNPSLNDGYGSAIATTGDGRLIVGHQNSQAVLWSIEDGYSITHFLENLPSGISSAVTAVTASGAIVVGGSSTINGNEAAFWNSHGIYSLKKVLTKSGLDLAGWKLMHISGVSADGSTVVGTAINPDGFTEGYVAVIPSNYIPEPTTLMLLCLGSICLLRRR